MSDVTDRVVLPPNGKIRWPNKIQWVVIVLMLDWPLMWIWIILG